MTLTLMRALRPYRIRMACGHIERRLARLPEPYSENLIVDAPGAGCTHCEISKISWHDKNHCFVCDGLQEEPMTAEHKRYAAMIEGAQ